MFNYQITCLPNGKTEMALSAPTSGAGNLIVAELDPSNARQLWQLAGFAAVENDKGTWNAFYLVNEQTGLVAQAPHDENGNVKGNTQGVSQADVTSSYGAVSPIRLWTMDYSKGAFAIRPLGDVHQNLNAWKGLAEPGVEVGIWGWQDGRSNELWTLKSV
jgi:hypothetical protein